MPKRKSKKLRVKGAGRARNRLPSNVGSMPVAYRKQMKAKLSLSHSRNGVRVSGWDLVQALPSVIATDSDPIFAVIPCNPCYWLGTRVAVLASAYQNYRPIRMVFHYVPQVAVTTPGTVITGTLWNVTSSTASLDQTLVTSNGGNMSQCYVPFSSSITLGSNLPQNLFSCAGSVNSESNPFIFIAALRGAPVVPGYFFVEYCFDLKNPLGYSVQYDLEKTVVPDWGAVRANRSVIVMDSIPGFSGPGTILDLEADGSTMYSGTLITVPEGAPCLVLSNTSTGPPTSVTNGVKSVIVTQYPPTVGSPLSSWMNYARWDWDTDTEDLSGGFSPEGATPAGFQRTTWDNLIIGISNVTSNLKFYVSRFDAATRTIGELITTVQAATAVAKLTISLAIMVGGTFMATRYERRHLIPERKPAGYDREPLERKPAEPTAGPLVSSSTCSTKF